MKNCFLIVNHNDYKSTKHLIDNIIDFNIIDHILIVDNKSNDEEITLLKQIKQNKIEILFNDVNAGYSGGINYGAKYLIEKYKECNLIISNSDIVIFAEDDLKKLIDLLNYEGIGLVGPQIIEKGNTNRGCKKITPNLEILCNLGLFKNRIRNKMLAYPNEYYEGEIGFVDVISSAFFLINSKTLERINYMDENLFLYYEEQVLSEKIKKLGLGIIISNKVFVKHLFSVSVDKVYKNKEKNKMFRESQLYYFNTFYNLNKIQKKLLQISSKFVKN